jgi:hypothetical protein
MDGDVVKRIPPADSPFADFTAAFAMDPAQHGINMLVWHTMDCAQYGTKMMMWHTLPLRVQLMMSELQQQSPEASQ